MKVRIQNCPNAAIVVVDVEEDGDLSDLLRESHLSKPFDQLEVIERHAGEIGTLDTRVVAGERYFIIVGLRLKD